MKYSLLLLMFFCAAAAFAQYPKASVQDIMRLPADSVNAGSLISPHNGDTVVLRGIVAVPPVVKFPDSMQKILIAGNKNWTVFLIDENIAAAKEYSGITVICDTSNSDSKFSRLQIGQLVEITGRVTNFPAGRLGISQFEMLANTKVEFIDDGMEIPPPPQVKISDFVSGTVPGTPQIATGAKYAGIQVELNNVNVVSVVKNMSSGRTTVILQDENGNQMYLRDQSNYFNTGQPINKFIPPPEGQRLSFVRGYITSNNLGGQPVPFMISPVFPGDVKADESAVPPTIGIVRSPRVNAFPTSSETVPVGAIVRKGAAEITAVTFYYTVDGGARQSIAATKINDTTYAAAIPPQAANSLIRWKISATDAADFKVSVPSVDTSYFFYRVLDRTAVIADVREQFTRNGNSVYQGYWVTLEGIVTASASDIVKTGTLSQPRVYIQDGAEGYSALYLKSDSPNAKIRAFSRGDKIKVKGVIVENFNLTALDSIENAGVSLISTGNAMPGYHQAATADFSGKAAGNQSVEPWESMLVEFKNVAVADTNADTGGNFGEFNIVDEAKFNSGAENQAKMRVETDEGSTTLATAPAAGKRVLQRGEKLSSIKGIMYFSFSNFKLVPRDDNDVTLNANSVEYSPDFVNSLEAFPNPFADNASLSVSFDSDVNASITLIDHAGNTVGSIADGFFAAGSYVFRLNSAGLSAGAYTCRIVIGNGTAATRLLIVR
ncbi:MAG: T9SS type A sorting domain-containing protein [Bacteroidetes bacterium]|nr:T9SS type A sorting domain-containing protein [Bacteroidota bacterium]